MATREELTSGLFEVSPGLFMDNLGQFHNVSEAGPVVPNQWAWDDTGLLGLGGETPHTITPFMEIAEQYRGGQAIEADTWQDAARKSLEGFMRTVHNSALNSRDPVTLFDPLRSGVDPGSQFRFGTLQDLIQDQTISGNFTGNPFFDTGANSPGIISEGIWGHIRNFDPAAANEMAALGVGPGTMLTSQQWEQMSPAARSAMTRLTDFNPANLGTGTQFDPLMGLSPTDRLLVFEDIPTGLGIEKMIGPLADWVVPGTDQDYNDYIFRLGLNEYQEAPALMKADPMQVMQQYFQTPAYQLMRGSEVDYTDPEMYRDPTARFRASPGYQFMQDEGMRNIQRNAAARGLLESGRTQRDLQTFGTNLADQEYQKWLGQEMAGFSDWQNQIRGLQAQGAAMSGPQAALQTGQGLANAGLQTGSNLASLFANQGVFGASGMLNTASAQAGNLMNAGNINAQIAAANAQSQASAAGGMGQMAGNLLGGFF